MSYYCTLCHEQWEDSDGSYTCPKCGDTDSIHSLACVECGKTFDCEEDSMPICDECLEKVYTSLDKALDFAEYEVAEDELPESDLDEKKKINTFYTWLFGADKINRILKEYAQKTATAEDVNSFFYASDTAEVEDYLRKEFDL